MDLQAYRNIGFNIMSLFNYSQSVNIQTCSSLAEASIFLKENNF